MMKSFTNSLLIASAVAALSVFVACGGGSDDDSSTVGSTGGTGSSTGGTGNTGACPGPADDVLLIPSDMGWIDHMDACNEIGIQGSWYPYGDSYGVAKCTGFGMHDPSECSTITDPLPPPAMGFPNQGGKMCTTGKVATILPCKDGVTTEGCPAHDYSNMWGAGIGFDFNAEGAAADGTPGAKHPWDPAQYGITGVSFEIEALPIPGLRVEFPIVLTAEEAANAGTNPPLTEGATTDDHPDGAPYWGATSSYPNSPVKPNAVNIVHWSDVKPPKTSYEYKPEKMLGIQFHVPAVSSGDGSYTFCINHLTFLRN